MWSQIIELSRAEGEKKQGPKVKGSMYETTVLKGPISLPDLLRLPVGHTCFYDLTTLEGFQKAQSLVQTYCAQINSKATCTNFTGVDANHNTVKLIRVTVVKSGDKRKNKQRSK